MPISVNNKEITAINFKGREIVRAHVGLSLVFSKQQPLYGGMDISSIADLVMFRDLINTGTCIWNGVSTNTYKGNPIATGGLGSTWYVTVDIDMSSVCGAGIGDWTPIGTNSRPFSGAIEGLGFTISNLYIGSSGTYRGLFGDTVCPVIKDLNLTNAYVVSSGYSGLLIARLGVNTSTTYFNPLIYNVKVSGSISCVALTYHSLVIGQIIGNTSRRTLIDTIEVLAGSSLSITANSSYYAGICSNATYSDFTNCINRASITAYDYSAGLFGLLDYSSMIDCKNYGAISGRQYTAGVCASYSNPSVNTIEKLYNYAQVTASSNFSGLINTVYKSGVSIVITDCHNSGNLIGTGSTVVAGILLRATASTLDLYYCTNNSICSGVNFNGLSSVSCDSIRHCTNDGSVANGAGIQYGIGSLKPTGIASYCVNNADLVSASGSCFGISNSGLTFEFCDNYGDLQCTGTRTSYNVYGISGSTASGVTITDCRNFGNLTNGGRYAAGIAPSRTGSTITTITNCRNEGNIVAVEAAAGIGGNRVTNCHNEGDVTITTTSTYQLYTVAGITTIMSTSMTNATFEINGCTNSGKITGKGHAGGILSYVYSTPSITNCTNTGTITAATWAAGIWGAQTSINGAVLTYCTNTGNITASSAGGILAISSGTNQVLKCTNSGAISGASQAGGIAAINAIVQYCRNNGAISGNNAAGIANNSQISYSLNTGNISGGSNYASGIGHGALQLSSLSVGIVTTTNSSIPKYIGGCGAYKPTTATANFYDTTVAGAIGAYRTVDIGGEGEGRPTSNLLGNSLLGAGSGWTTDNWVFTDGEYPTPRMD